MKRLVVFYFLFAGILAFSQNISEEKSDKGLITITLHKCMLPTGIGDADQRIVGIKVYLSYSNLALTNIVMKMTGTTDINDVSAVKLYYTGDSSRFFVGSGSSLLSTKSPSNNDISFDINQILLPDSNFFWLVYDVSSSAIEGHELDATVDSVVINGSLYLPSNQNGGRTILLTNTLLFSCNDAGSKHYRIPAIVTAADGSLVTATDKRWNNSGDLPNDIDVLIRRSTDNGKTWSVPLTIAGDGTTLGYGDPALCVDKSNGNIICLMASGPGLWGGTAADPLRIMKCVSSDNGLTWTAPADITDMIYGSGCSNSITKTWRAAFVASGSFSQFSNGRLAAVVAVRRTSSTTLDNYVIYSDDHGNTWNISTNIAKAGGDEAKMVELADSTILMSIRNPSYRSFNKSNDYGITWGTPYNETEIIDPKCNGDMIRYTCVNDGYDRNRILHSIPYAPNRSNVSVLLSYDEGDNWPIRKTIYPGASAYSSLCILSDGTIGIYYEVGEYEIYQMYFVRFSLDWLSDGTDHFNVATDININNTDQGELLLFPNPSDGIFNIVSKNRFADSILELSNAEGKQIFSCKASDLDGSMQSKQLDLSSYPSGLYFVQLKGKAHTLSARIIKQ
jgi:hypothetical protein